MIGATSEVEVVSRSSPRPGEPCCSPTTWSTDIERLTDAQHVAASGRTRHRWPRAV